MGQSDVDKLIQNTLQYEYADGLRDLQMAVVWVSIGVTSWFVFDQARVWLAFAIHLANVLGGWARWITMLLVFLPTLLGFGALTLITYARKRWLWRESGWVRPSRSPTPRWVWVIVAAIFLVSVLLSVELYRQGLVNDLFVLKMLVAASSWATGYYLAALGRNIGLSRYIWLGIAGGLVPTIVLFIPLTFGETWLAVGLWWGFVSTVSGVWALRHKMLSLSEGE